MHVRAGTRFKPRLCFWMNFQSVSLSLPLLICTVDYFDGINSNIPQVAASHDSLQEQLELFSKLNKIMKY